MRSVKTRQATLPTVKIDNVLKDELYGALSEVGINYSSLINIFVKQWLSGKVKIELEVRDENGFKQDVVNEILRRGKEAENKINLVSHAELVKKS